MVFEPIEIQQKRIPEYLRKFVYSRLDILYPQVAFHRAGYRQLGGVQKEIIGSTVENGILLGFTAVIIDKNIPHDGIKPGLYISTDIVFILIG
jgi:hypothetical protein